MKQNHKVLSSHVAHHQAPKCKAKLQVQLQICNEKNSNSKLNAYLLNEVGFQ